MSHKSRQYEKRGKSVISCIILHIPRSHAQIPKSRPPAYTTTSDPGGDLVADRVPEEGMQVADRVPEEGMQVNLGGVGKPGQFSWCVQRVSRSNPV